MGKVNELEEVKVDWWNECGRGREGGVEPVAKREVIELARERLAVGESVVNGEEATKLDGGREGEEPSTEGLPASRVLARSISGAPNVVVEGDPARLVVDAEGWNLKAGAAELFLL